MLVHVYTTVNLLKKFSEFSVHSIVAYNPIYVYLGVRLNELGTQRLASQ